MFKYKLFRMESLNEAIGESEDAFFNIKHFTENQEMTCWRPPTISDLYMDRDTGNRPKGEDEIRLIVVDFAFANSISRSANDNTIILCMSLHWKRNRFERHLDYIEGFEASDSLGAADRVRALRTLYQADYVVMDGRAGGETLYNYLTMPKENETYGNFWESRGLTIADKYQMVTQTKLDDYRHRTVDPEAIPCLIPFTITLDQSSACWVELRKQLEVNNIKFLQSMQNRQTTLEDNGRYFEMTAEDIANELAPYGQMDSLVVEAVNLKAEYKMDKIKLTEPKTGTKDRIVCLSYGNYIASLIETAWNKQLQETDYSIDDWQLVW